MQYFVSIENISYFHWQIELLIESFKHHKLEDKLCVAIAENKTPCIVNYKKNIIQHQNRLVHPNNELKCINKIHGLISFLESGRLKAPYTIIHPDHLLLKPVEQGEPTILFHEENLNTIKFQMEPITSAIAAKFNLREFTWIPLGDVIVVNHDLPIDFYSRILHIIESLKDKFDNKKLDKMAWILLLHELLFIKNPPPISIEGGKLEQSLLDHNVVTNFIHYKHGMPPEFSKYYYKYELPLALVPNGLDPFHAIYANNVTTSTDYVCKLIKSYLGSDL